MTLSGPKFSMTQPSIKLKRRSRFLFKSGIRRRDQGFSLLEVLTVLAIMAVLTGISLSAIPGMRSTYNRKSAVDIVVTTIEQARVAALQSGGNVYVVLAETKDGGVSPDAIMVVGDQPIGSMATGLVYYTHWIKLPQNVRFHNFNGTLGASAEPTAVSHGVLPPLNGNPAIYGFTFNSTGMIVYPSPVTTSPNGGFDLALFEGVRSKKAVESALGPESKNSAESLSATGTYDVIRLSQYSGRSWVDVCNLSQL